MEQLSEIQAASELRECFTDLAVSLIKELVDNHTLAEELRKYMATLPLSLNKKITLPMKSHEDPIQNLAFLTDLFHLFNVNVWNFFDYHILKYVIDKFGSDDIRDSMAQYVSNFKKFEENTLLYNFFECWPGRMQKLPGYTDVVTRIDENPKYYTLAELDQFRQSICSKLLPPLSEKAMFYYKRVSWLHGFYQQN